MAPGAFSRRPRLRLRCANACLASLRLDRGAQLARRLRGVFRLGEGANHGDAACPRRHDARHVLGVDSPDREEGNPIVGGRVAHELEPHGGAPRLGRRLVHGADADVVGAAGGVHLGGGMGREPDEPVLADQRPGRRHRRVVPAHMDPVRPDLGRQVGTIVEEEQRAVLGAAASEGLGGAQDRLVGRRFHPQLHDVDAAAQSTLEPDLGKRIADEVEAGGAETLSAFGHDLSLACRRR